MSKKIIWIKNPLAIYADNSEGGVVVQGKKIIELVAQGKTPKTNIDPRLSRGIKSRAVSLA
jgi:8-oxoguanine deaminase